MRTLSLWHVDAFTKHAFSGNPACVVALDQSLDDKLMQAIAAENNLSETAFVLPQGVDYSIRWFTPEQEVDLCGHATLASAFVVFEHLEPTRDQVTFHSKSGPLNVSFERKTERLVLDFPEYMCERAPLEDDVAAALGGARPEEVWLGPKLMAVFATEHEVRAVQPDFARVRELPAFGLMVTAPGDDCDFVSRYFVPQAGVNEDPVTGSAHCQLTPWWVKRLGRNPLRARQVSRRGGELWVEHAPPRVRIAGYAAEYLRGTVRL